jgi:hypothetical protein
MCFLYCIYLSLKKLDKKYKYKLYISQETFVHQNIAFNFNVITMLKLTEHLL